MIDRISVLHHLYTVRLFVSKLIEELAGYLKQRLRIKWLGVRVPLGAPNNSIHLLTDYTPFYNP